jgi:hypothetical protein
MLLGSVDSIKGRGKWVTMGVLRASSWPRLDIRSVPSFHVRDHRGSEWSNDYRVTPQMSERHIKDAWSRNE